MKVMDERLSGRCYLRNIPKTNVCQIVDNVKNIEE